MDLSEKYNIVMFCSFVFLKLLFFFLCVCLSFFSFSPPEMMDIGFTVYKIQW